MEGLKNTVSEAADILSGIEKTREKAIRDSRDVIRLTKKIIHSIHVGDTDVKSLKELMKDLMQDAMAEYAETAILYSVVEHTPVPSFSDLRISPQSWILGLADSLGEMRRLLLTMLLDSRITDARSLYSEMDEVYDAIITFDIPDAIVPIRRKQDIARGIMDRTRADITTAVLMNNAVS
jgi:Predicted RNA-binding protein of the translin family